MPRFIWVCVILLTPLCQTASAVDYFWTNSVGGAFDEPSNWSPFAPPATQGPGGPNDTVNFDLGVATSNRYVVTDAGRENDQLIVHNDSVEVTIFIDHALLSTGGAEPSLVVGASTGDTGDLILSSGGASILETEVTRIANAADSVGVVTASNLQWTGGNLRVGWAGDGELKIIDDASVSSSNASIGHLVDSSGVARIQDGGDWTVTGELLVARADSGSMIIGPGGSVTSASASVGTLSSGNGGVIVSTGTWTNTGSVTFGESGVGTLSINEFGGTVSNGDAYVGRVLGSLGHNVIRGGMWSTTGRLSIGGDAGSGISGGLGIVEVFGGTVAVSNEIVIFPNGQLTIDGGTLTSAIITTQAGATLDFLSGTLLVDTVIGSLSNQGGLLATLPGSNSILVSGEYVQAPAGVLSMEIEGTAASNQYDSLIVGNTAFLGGELQISLSDQFEPGSNEVYTIVEALNLGAGSFSNVVSGQRLDVIDGTGSFLVHYGLGSPFDPSQVVLSEFQPAGVTGDYNDDGIVDAADYVAWRKNVGTTNSLPNDEIGGMIGTPHYDQWREHFNETAGNGAGATANSTAVGAVPEPAPTALISIVPIVALSLTRRRRQR